MDKITWNFQEREISILEMNKRNPRCITEKGMKDLGNSIGKFGLAEPIVINTNNTVIGGHARILYLKSIGVKECSCSVPSRELDVGEERELNRRLNRNIAGEWNWDILSSDDTPKELLDWGFEKWEMDLKEDIEVNPEDNEVPEVRKTDIKLGDVFQLGNHRLLCGDATKDVGKLMQGEKANLIMTSSPYWVGKEYEKEKSEAEINNFIEESVSCFVNSINIDYSRIVINSGTGMATALGEKHTRTILLLDKWINELLKHNWLLRYLRMWIKGGGQPRPRRPIDDVVYHGCEFILVFYNSKGKKRGQERVSSLWAQQDNWSDILGDRQENRAGYPVELPLRNIILYTKKHEIVYEPFGGNGTTLIACEKSNRKCYMMEISPEYCDVIVSRWCKLTGINEVIKNGKRVRWKI